MSNLRHNWSRNGHCAKNVLESLKEEKARVLCGDQKIGVILPFLLKILQEGRRKKLGKEFQVI